METEPIIQYYYNRWSEYPTKVYCPPGETQGPENRISWHKCSWERGLKRYRAACETDSFYHYVALVTGNEKAITVREAFVGKNDDGDGDDPWQGFITLTLNKEGIFGDASEDFQNQFVLSIFANAMETCVDEATAC